MADQIKITVLEDGTISIDTGAISGANHASADQFLNEIAKLAGGTRETTKKKEKTMHVHNHGGLVHSH